MSGPTLEERVTKIEEALWGTPLQIAVANLSKDMHTPSDRPCATCKSVTIALGKPFGCYEFAQRRGKTID